MTNKKICVYAICKNESKFVEQWINNMAEADYIVVLDTGSTDDTVEKLKADSRVTTVKTKKITPWRFDVARNESMKLVPADADILVCTDFDELFNPGWASVIRNHWQDTTTRMFYNYAWSHSEIGEPTDIFLYDKIHTRDYHWVYPVHEVLMPLEPEFQQVGINVGNNIFLHHYRDTTKERGSYFDLLKLSVSEFPGDSHVQMLLAREYLIRNDKENALAEYLKCLKLADINESNKKLVLLESLGRVADLYFDQKNFDEAIWYAQEFIKEDATYREPYFILAEVYNNMKMYTLAEAMIEAALKHCTRKYDWVERADTWLGQADDLLSVTKYYLGKTDEAIVLVQKALKYHPDDPRLLKNYNCYLGTKLQETAKKLEATK